MRPSLPVDAMIERACLQRQRLIIGRHILHGVLSDEEGAALLEVEDARRVDEELSQAELKWLLEILQSEGSLPGEKP